MVVTGPPWWMVPYAVFMELTASMMSISPLVGHPPYTPQPLQVGGLSEGSIQKAGQMPCPPAAESHKLIHGSRGLVEGIWRRAV